MAPKLILGDPYTTTVDIWSFDSTVVEVADSAPSFADYSSFTAFGAISELTTDMYAKSSLNFTF